MRDSQVRNYAQIPTDRHQVPVSVEIVYQHGINPRARRIIDFPPKHCETITKKNAPRFWSRVRRACTAAEFDGFNLETIKVMWR